MAILSVSFIVSNKYEESLIGPITFSNKILENCINKDGRKGFGGTL